MKIELIITEVHLLAILNLVIAFATTFLLYRKVESDSYTEYPFRFYIFAFVAFYFFWPLAYIISGIAKLCEKYPRIADTFIASKVWISFRFKEKEELMRYKAFLQNNMSEAKKSTWQYKAVVRAIDYYLSKKQ